MKANGRANTIKSLFINTLGQTKQKQKGIFLFKNAQEMFGNGQLGVVILQ